VVQSGVANAPLGVPSVSVTYACATVYGPSGEESFVNNSYALQCNINEAGNGAGYKTTLTGTPTTIQVSVQTSTATARMFRPGQGRGGVGWLYKEPKRKNSAVCRVAVADDTHVRLAGLQQFVALLANAIGLLDAKRLLCRRRGWN
jgi:hypothetical protein